MHLVTSNRMRIHAEKPLNGLKDLEIATMITIDL